MTSLWVESISLTANAHDYTEKYQLLGEQVHSKCFSGFNSISMEVVANEKFKTLKPTTIHMAKSYSRVSDEIDQDSSTTATHLLFSPQLLLTKKWCLHSW